MEVCVPFHALAGQDISRSSGPVTDPLHRTRCNSRDLSLKALQTCFSRFLSIGDTGVSTAGRNFSPKKNVIVNVVREDGFDDSQNSGVIISTSDNSGLASVGKAISSVDESLSVIEKLAISPVDESLSGIETLQDDNTTDVSKVNHSAQSVDDCSSQSKSPPSPLKLVSAMKGSREKPRKLSVMWAPDVYDPVPTSVSHVPSSKNHHHRHGKKYGSKQKSSNSKSSRSKSTDKKSSTRKSSSRSSSRRTIKYQLYDSYDDVSEADTLDPFWRTSLLKKSVIEATT